MEVDLGEGTFDCPLPRDWRLVEPEPLACGIEIPDGRRLDVRLCSVRDAEAVASGELNAYHPSDDLPAGLDLLNNHQLELIGDLEGRGPHGRVTHFEVLEPDLIRRVTFELPLPGRAPRQEEAAPLIELVAGYLPRARSAPRPTLADGAAVGPGLKLTPLMGRLHLATLLGWCWTSDVPDYPDTCFMGSWDEDEDFATLWDYPSEYGLPPDLPARERAGLVDHFLERTQAALEGSELLEPPRPPRLLPAYGESLHVRRYPDQGEVCLERTRTLVRANAESLPLMNLHLVFPEKHLERAASRAHIERVWACAARAWLSDGRSR